MVAMTVVWLAMALVYALQAYWLRLMSPLASLLLSILAVFAVVEGVTT